MTINLPIDVERSIEAAVHNGRFASVDDAIAEAWRLFLRHPLQPRPTPGLGSIGAMRDAADELDEIVADAMKRRERETWRDISVE
jgi:Arc/MetJ-type ribon-helix-helix transcriptional regulator